MVMREILKGKKDKHGRDYDLAVRGEYMRDETEELGSGDKSGVDQEKGEAKGAKVAKDHKGQSKDEKSADADNQKLGKNWVDFTIMLTVGGQEKYPLVTYEVKVSIVDERSSYMILTKMLENGDPRTGLGNPHDLLGQKA